MSENHLKIKDLTPNTRGQLTLLFEVAKIVEKSKSGESMTCRIVDETGIITAYFDQYANFINEGSVLEIKNFRCKVVDHHLRLQMIKNTILTKQPIKICFRDMENDLSQKFYVPVVTSKPDPSEKSSKVTVQEVKKTKQEELRKQPKQESKGESQQGHKHQSAKDRYQKIQRSAAANKDQEGKIGKQREIQKRYVQKKGQREEKRHEEVYRQQKQDEWEVSHNVRLPRYKQREVRNHEREVRNNEGGNTQEEEKKPSRIKYVAKSSTIKVTQMPQYQEEEKSFCVFINISSKIEKKQYLLCKVSDSSGSTYFQFDPWMRKHLEDKTWYRLIGFKIYGDRDYGFIATQQKHSTFEVVEDCEEKANQRLLWK